VDNVFNVEIESVGVHAEGGAMNSEMAVGGADRIGGGRTVLVASDGSDESLNAVRWSANVARRLGWALRIVDVTERRSIEMGPEDSEAYDRDVAERLRVHLADHGEKAGTVEVREGDPESVLAGLSADADLLVLGSKPVEGFTKRGFLSITNRLAHRSACPVVAVPSGNWLGSDEVWMVGLDGSRGSLITLRWAKSVAAALGARVVGLFVVDPVYESFDSEGWYGRDELRARHEADVEGVELFERTGGDPAHVLRDFAEELKASVIVVGAKFRHSLGGVVMGKVPEELLHKPPRPIAVVTHDYEERHLSD
jgi:nucleotide-binding universal stress UspA family protein